MALENDPIVRIEYNSEYSFASDNGYLADFFIGFKDGTKICSHRYILSLVSKYFKEKFDLNPSLAHFLLPDQFRSDIMKFVIFCIYNRYVNIHQSNLSAFLKAVKYLQLNGFDKIQGNNLKCEKELRVTIKRLTHKECEKAMGECNDKSHQIDNDSRKITKTIGNLNEKRVKKPEKSIKVEKNPSNEKGDSTSQNIKRQRERPKKNIECGNIEQIKQLNKEAEYDFRGTSVEESPKLYKSNRKKSEAPTKNEQSRKSQRAKKTVVKTKKSMTKNANKDEAETNPSLNQSIDSDFGEIEDVKRVKKQVAYVLESPKPLTSKCQKSEASKKGDFKPTERSRRAQNRTEKSEQLAQPQTRSQSRLQHYEKNLAANRLKSFDNSSSEEGSIPALKIDKITIKDDSKSYRNWQVIENGNNESNKSKKNSEDIPIENKNPLSNQIFEANKEKECVTQSLNQSIDLDRANIEEVKQVNEQAQYDFRGSSDVKSAKAHTNKKSDAPTRNDCKQPRKSKKSTEKPKKTLKQSIEWDFGEIEEVERMEKRKEYIFDYSSIEENPEPSTSTSKKREVSKNEHFNQPQKPPQKLRTAEKNKKQPEKLSKAAPSKLDETFIIDTSDPPTRACIKLCDIDIGKQKHKNPFSDQIFDANSGLSSRNGIKSALTKKRLRGKKNLQPHGVSKTNRTRWSVKAFFKSNSQKTINNNIDSFEAQSAKGDDFSAKNKFASKIDDPFITTETDEIHADLVKFHFGEISFDNSMEYPIESSVTSSCAPGRKSIFAQVVASTPKQNGSNIKAPKREVTPEIMTTHDNITETPTRKMAKRIRLIFGNRSKSRNRINSSGSESSMEIPRAKFSDTDSESAIVNEFTSGMWKFGSESI